MAQSSSEYVYSYIWNTLITTNPQLAEFSSSVFDYTWGSPNYIPLWDMLSIKYRNCYKTGFPLRLDIITIFPPGTQFNIGKTDLKSYEATTNLGLLQYVIQKDPNWVKNELEMPRYYFPYVINLYRYLYQLREYKSRIPFLVNYEETLFIYTYIICTKIGVRDFDGICPDLCGHGADVCGRTPYSLPHTCVIVDEGVMENQFSCQCQVGYKWEINLKRCVKKIDQKCNLIAMQNFCESTKTEKCIEKPDSPYPKCVCKEGYHGDDCSLKDSRCLQPSIEKDQPSGFEACRVLQGGLCNKTSNNDYICVCPKTYKHDIQFLYPNCYKLEKLNLCSSVVCLNGGRCIQKSELIVLCNCELGYMGSYCELPEGTWTAWTRWSQCYPTCGPRRERYRFRDCLGDTSCRGSMVQSAVCEYLLCEPSTRKLPLNLNVVLHSVFMIDKRYNPMIWMLTYSSQALAIEIALILVVGGVLALCTWLLLIFEPTFGHVKVVIRRKWHGIAHRNEPFVE